MTAPEYEIVATVTAGDCLTTSTRFAAGVPGQPIGIGRQAQWAVAAEGVAPVHLYVAFDGQNLFAASALPGALVTLAGRPLAAEWTHVPVPSELRFGAASISVTRAAAGRAQPAAQSWGGERTVHDGGALFAAAQRAMADAVHAAAPPAPVAAAAPPPQVAAAPPQPMYPPLAAPAPVPPPQPVVAAPPGPSAAPPPAPAAPNAALAFWSSASPVKKITLLLLPVVLVMTALALKQEDDRAEAEAAQAALAVKQRAAKAAASASAAAAASVAEANVPPVPRPSDVAAVPVADASAVATNAAEAEDDDADGEAASAADAGAKGAKLSKSDRARDKREAKNKRTPERLALDAVAAGSYADAAKMYDALSASHPLDPTYREAARILRDRLRVGE